MTEKKEPDYQKKIYGILITIGLFLLILIYITWQILTILQNGFTLYYA